MTAGLCSPPWLRARHNTRTIATTPATITARIRYMDARKATATAATITVVTAITMDMATIILTPRAECSAWRSR